MVMRRFKKKSNRPRRRAARRFAVGRPLRANPRPIFTETFRLFTDDPLAPPYRLSSNTGGVLSVKISQMPQIAQYTTLYQKYRILKATFICLPQFVSQSSDVNAAYYNQSLGLGAWGMSRLITAVNTSPEAVAPVAEDDILEDNGCKIHTGKPKLVLSCRPVPDTLDANGNRMTLRNKYLNFNPTGDITHYGIRWWHSIPNITPNSQDQFYFVYCKLTFQLADPR